MGIRVGVPLLVGIVFVASRIFGVGVGLSGLFGLGLFGLYFLVEQIASQPSFLQVLNNSLLPLVLVLG